MVLMMTLSAVGLRQPPEIKDLDHRTEVTASASAELKKLTKTAEAMRPILLLPA